MLRYPEVQTLTVDFVRCETLPGGEKNGRNCFLFRVVPRVVERDVIVVEGAAGSTTFGEGLYGGEDPRPVGPPATTVGAGGSSGGDPIGGGSWINYDGRAADHPLHTADGVDPRNVNGGMELRGGGSDVLLAQRPPPANERVLQRLRPVAYRGKRYRYNLFGEKPVKQAGHAGAKRNNTSKERESRGSVTSSSSGAMAVSGGGSAPSSNVDGCGLLLQQHRASSAAPRTPEHRARRKSDKSESEEPLTERRLREGLSSSTMMSQHDAQGTTTQQTPPKAPAGAPARHQQTPELVQPPEEKPPPEENSETEKPPPEESEENPKLVQRRTLIVNVPRPASVASSNVKSGLPGVQPQIPQTFTNIVDGGFPFPTAVRGGGGGGPDLSHRGGPLVAASSETGSNFDDICAICRCKFLASDDVLGMPCQHVYHYDCCRNWLALNRSCPVCRDEVTTQYAGESGLAGAAGAGLVGSGTGSNGASASGGMAGLIGAAQLAGWDRTNNQGKTSVGDKHLRKKNPEDLTTEPVHFGLACSFCQRAPLVGNLNFSCGDCGSVACHVCFRFGRSCGHASTALIDAFCKIRNPAALPLVSSVSLEQALSEQERGVLGANGAEFAG